MLVRADACSVALQKLSATSQTVAQMKANLLVCLQAGAPAMLQLCLVTLGKKRSMGIWARCRHSGYLLMRVMYGERPAEAMLATRVLNQIRMAELVVRIICEDAGILCAACVFSFGRITGPQLLDCLEFGQVACLLPLLTLGTSFNCPASKHQCDCSGIILFCSACICVNAPFLACHAKPRRQQATAFK